MVLPLHALGFAGCLVDSCFLLVAFKEFLFHFVCEFLGKRGGVLTCDASHAQFIFCTARGFNQVPNGLVTHSIRTNYFSDFLGAVPRTNELPISGHVDSVEAWSDNAWESDEHVNFFSP